MPVKVQCPECDAVLNAPDGARGKAIKCPKCSGRVPVPAAGAARSSSSGSRPQQRRAGGKRSSDDADASSFFDDINLNHLEDRRVQICPKCGRELPEDQMECPKCGIDVRTGQLTAKARKRKSMKGPDPEKYYSKIWSESWAYLTANKKQPIRTSIYALISLLLTFGCLYGYTWSATPPPKVFWGFLMLVSAGMAPGWSWFLNLTVIRNTMKKGKKLDRVNFDFLLCTGLGIGSVFWFTFFGLGLPILAGFMIYNDNFIVGVVILAVQAVLTIPLFPIAMTHMAMPVTYKGWLSPVIAPLFFRVAKGAMMFMAVFLVGMAPVILGCVLTAAIFGEDVYDYFNTLNFNTRVRAAQGAEDWKPPKQPPATQEAADPNAPPVDLQKQQLELQEKEDPHFWFRKAAEQELDHTVLIIPGVIAGVTCIFYGFCAFFVMRANGLFSYYFGAYLDLIDTVKETTWNPKKKKPKKGEEPLPEEEPEEEESH